MTQKTPSVIDKALMGLPSIHDKSIPELHDLVETTRHALGYIQNDITLVTERVAFIEWCDLLVNFLEPITQKFYEETFKVLSSRFAEKGGAR